LTAVSHTLGTVASCVCGSIGEKSTQTRYLKTSNKTARFLRSSRVHNHKCFRHFGLRTWCL